MTQSLIRSLDHLVLTVVDIDATIVFYTEALGMVAETFAGGRRSLTFGRQKINLHQAGREFEPKAIRPTPGSGDLCFLSDTPVIEIIDHLTALGISVEEGPVSRTGATGQLRSIYLRDPDGNLIEISNLISN